MPLSASRSILLQNGKYAAAAHRRYHPASRRRQIVAFVVWGTAWVVGQVSCGASQLASVVALAEAPCLVEVLVGEPAGQAEPSLAGAMEAIAEKADLEISSPPIGSHYERRCAAVVEQQESATDSCRLKSALARSLVESQSEEMFEVG